MVESSTHVVATKNVSRFEKESHSVRESPLHNDKERFLRKKETEAIFDAKISVEMQLKALYFISASSSVKLKIQNRLNIEIMQAIYCLFSQRVFLDQD